MDGDAAEPGHGERADGAVGEPAPAPADQRASRQLFAGLADVGAEPLFGSRIAADADEGFAASLHILLPDDEIGPVGYPRAGEDALAAAAFQRRRRARGTCCRGCRHGKAKRAFRAREICAGDCVAIHRALPKRGKVDAGKGLLCEHPSERLAQRQPARWQRANLVIEMGEGVVDRDHVCWLRTRRTSAGATAARSWSVIPPCSSTTSSVRSPLCEASSRHEAAAGSRRTAN